MQASLPRDPAAAPMDEGAGRDAGAALPHTDAGWPHPDAGLASPARDAAIRGRGWPGLCAVCRGWGRQRICDDCRVRWAVPVARCRRCALEVPAGSDACGACLVEPPPFDAALAAVGYGPPWDRLVTAFKFHGALDLAPAFAELLLRAHAQSTAPSPALLLPVPLSPQRLRARGYNQAWELARRLARRLRVPTDPRLLLRVRDTPHQLALAPGERAANVRGAFAVEPLRAAELRGRHVTVVDDVMTTGATATEVARVLRAAGAAQVDVWVLARTPRPEAAERG